VGSTHDAKKVIDAVDDLENTSDFREDQLAIRWGFKSRKEMLAASKPIEDRAGTSWWATKLPEGDWIVWNEDAIRSGKHATLDEAKQCLLASEAADEPQSSSRIPGIFIG
jgi:hypothetical protein